MLKNNKETFWDEVAWGLVSIICLVIGIYCVVRKPSIGIISGNVTQIIGGVLGTIGIVLIPMVIYNLFHNDK